MKKRSIGVTISATIAIVFGAFSLSQYLVASQSWLKDLLHGNLPENVSLMTIFVSTLAIAYIVCGIGALRLKRWAREFLIFFMVVGIFYYISGIFTPACAPVIVLVFLLTPFILVHALVIYLLTRPKVKAKFAEAERESNSA